MRYTLYSKKLFFSFQKLGAGGLEQPNNLFFCLIADRVIQTKRDSSDIISISSHSQRQGRCSKPLPWCTEECLRLRSVSPSRVKLCAVRLWLLNLVGRTTDQSIMHCWDHPGQPEVKLLRNDLWLPNVVGRTPDHSVMHCWGQRSFWDHPGSTRGLIT